MTPQILCIGAVLWDVIGRSPGPMSAGDDVPGRIRHLPGGVALNVALALARRGWRAAVLGAVGRDAEGDALAAAIAARGVATGWLTRGAGPTDVYMAVEDSRGLVAAIADAHSLEHAGAAVWSALSDGRLGAPDRPWSGPVVLDGNLTRDQLAAAAADPALAAADLRVVPASPGKADRLLPLLGRPRATLYLNRAEAETLAGRPCPDAAAAAAAVAARGAGRVLVTDGPRPAACAVAGGPVLTAAPPRVTVARVTGAGDCFLAAHLVAEHGGADRQAALDAAVAAAAAHVAGADA
ncbi:PfkB family carbohydrate kinase [Paracoccus luteus]|uniref:PfkB family carbohydrate kinase n=1 Tax=Paracoccus luteus TaxID=2508543 RepID=UPI00106F6A24|nr:PfkB family carbohydrate kinase [Paracoccus luteus]